MTYTSFDLYYHMVNHYKKIKNAKAVVDCSSPKGYNKRAHESNPSSVPINSPHCSVPPVSCLPRPSCAPECCASRQKSYHRCCSAPCPGTEWKTWSRCKNRTCYGTCTDPKINKLLNQLQNDITQKYENGKKWKGRQKATDIFPVKIEKAEKVELSPKVTPIKLAPRPKPKSEPQDHEYVHFLLKITEDILRNNIYDDLGLEKLFQSHVEANKSRLNEAKMWKQIDDLKNELSLPHPPSPCSCEAKQSGYKCTSEIAKTSTDYGGASNSEEPHVTSEVESNEQLWSATYSKVSSEDFSKAQISSSPISKEIVVEREPSKAQISSSSISKEIVLEREPSKAQISSIRISKELVSEREPSKAQISSSSISTEIVLEREPSNECCAREPCSAIECERLYGSVSVEQKSCVSFNERDELVELTAVSSQSIKGISSEKEFQSQPGLIDEPPLSISAAKIKKNGSSKVATLAATESSAFKILTNETPQSQIYLYSSKTNTREPLKRTALKIETDDKNEDYVLVDGPVCIPKSMLETQTVPILVETLSVTGNSEAQVSVKTATENEPSVSRVNLFPRYSDTELDESSVNVDSVSGLMKQIHQASKTDYDMTPERDEVTEIQSLEQTVPSNHGTKQSLTVIKSQEQVGALDTDQIEPLDTEQIETLDTEQVGDLDTEKEEISAKPNEETRVSDGTTKKVEIMSNVSEQKPLCQADDCPKKVKNKKKEVFSVIDEEPTSRDDSDFARKYHFLLVDVTTSTSSYMLEDVPEASKHLLDDSYEIKSEVLIPPIKTPSQISLSDSFEKLMEEPMVVPLEPSVPMEIPVVEKRVSEIFMQRLYEDEDTPPLPIEEEVRTIQPIDSNASSKPESSSTEMEPYISNKQYTSASAYASPAASRPEIHKVRYSIAEMPGLTEAGIAHGLEQANLLTNGRHSLSEKLKDFQEAEEVTNRRFQISSPTNFEIRRASLSDPKDKSASTEQTETTCCGLKKIKKKGDTNKFVFDS